LRRLAPGNAFLLFVKKKKKGKMSWKNRFLKEKGACEAGSASPVAARACFVGV